MSAKEVSAADELRDLAGALPPDVRSLVGAGWARAAQAEHASIASFARFTLELLAVGAPPELLKDAQNAALDEIAHAERAFEIASIYAGESLGPGKLPIAANTIGDVTLEGLIAGTIAEGCVNETLAAAEAEAARDAAIPAAVKDALARVAADEAAHAALAFRFVSWAIGVGGSPAREIARTAFARELALRQSEPLLEAARESLVSGHGLLPAAERRALRLEVVTRVLEPAADALFRSSQSSGV
jgi:hypothetical protein